MSPLSFPYNFSQSTYNTILSILGILTLIIPFTGKVHDGRRRWFRGFTARGWIVLGISFFIVIVSNIKDSANEMSDVLKVQNAKIEKHNDEKLSRKLNDESNATTIKTFTTALAKYGLRYDSATNVIQQSIKTTASKATTIDPEVTLCSISTDSVASDTKLIYTFCVSQVAVYNFSTEIYYVVRSIDNELTFLKQDNSYLKSDKITVSNEFNASINLVNKGKAISKVYFYAKSKYHNKVGKMYESFDLIAFNFSNQIVNFLTPKESIWIKNFYRKNGINIPESTKNPTQINQ